MIRRISRELRRRSWRFFRTPFGRLLTLFAGRIFHGSGTEDLDSGMGAVLVLLAMPGLLVSLLAFEKYGSLIHFLRGGAPFNVFTATVPDEYFFIVLSLSVSGAAALWRWDAIFLDRRDYLNLVPLPVSLTSLFFANIGAIVVSTVMLAVVVNAASSLLFPLAVFGSQPSTGLVFRFAAGHLVGVLAASVFGCVSVFAVTGVLMALLPARIFRFASHLVRFLIAMGLLTLLATCFVVPDWLASLPVPTAHRVAVLPPMSLLGLTRLIWLGRADPFTVIMARSATQAIAAVLAAAVLGYIVSFRRTFLATPETSGPIAPSRGSAAQSTLWLSPAALLLSAPQLACYRFVARTLLRSEAHLQIALGSLALGLVLSVQSFSSASDLHSLLAGSVPPVELLSVPFIVSFCLIAGLRFAFEVPADLPANWVFRLWLDRDASFARTAASRVLLGFSLSWILPLSFLSTLRWGWPVALVHLFFVAVAVFSLVQCVLLTFRKLPFTCPYPSFRSHSGLIALAYLFAFLFFTGYLVEFEQWILADLWRATILLPLAVALPAAARSYRKQLLEMDKDLLFEEPQTSAF